MLTLLWGEWFKQRRRWMPYILLGLFILIGQLLVWGTFVATLVSPGSGARDGFELPTALGTYFNLSLQLAVIAVTVLTSALVASEYANGTLRTILARGVRREELLASKLLLVALLLAAALVIASLLIVVASLIAMRLEPAPAGHVARLSWVGAAAAFGRFWFAALPYAALTGLIAVVMRSPGPAIGLSIAYFFAELIVVGIFGAVFHWFYHVANLLPAHAIQLWSDSGGPGSQGSHIPSNWQTFFVLLGYLALFSFLALRIFKRRDITGPTGA